MKKVYLVFVMAISFAITAFAGYSDEVVIIYDNASTISMSADNGYVSDLANAVVAESGSSNEIKFNYTFVLDANDVKTKYNETHDYNKLEDGGDGKVKFNVSICAYSGDEYIYDGYLRSTYAYSEYDLLGNNNADYLFFVAQNENAPFITATCSGSMITVNVNTTVKEIADYISANTEYDGSKMTDIFLEFNVCGTKHQLSYDGSYEYETLWEPFKGAAINVADAHKRDGRIGLGLDGNVQGYYSEVALITPITVVDYIPLGEGEVDDRFYTPVSASYKWMYEMVRLVGDESESLVGEYVTSSPTFCIEDIITEENSDFAYGLVGAGWNGSIHLEQETTFTFADGITTTILIHGPFESLMIVSPCIHSCAACGLCTVKDYTTSCNANMDMYSSRMCICETPSPIEIEIEAIPEDGIVIGEDSVTDLPVTVKIDKVGFGSALDTPVIKRLAKSIDLDKTVLVLDIRIYNEYDEPYKLNKWTEGESLTITVNVGSGNAAAVAAGTLVLYHIADDGTVEIIEAVANVTNDTITFTSDSFSFYALGEPETDEPDEPAVEDIDGDGRVTIADAMLVLSALLNEQVLENGDVNGDGEVTLIDVIRVLKATVA